MGLKPGDRVEATVTEVAIYGLHCLTEHDDPALLLIPYISWIPSFCSCQQFASVGDIVEAEVRFIDSESGKIALTHRDLYANPWEVGLISKGARFNAIAFRHVPSADRCGGDPALLVRLVPGAYAMLCGEHTSISLGSTLPVSIAEVDLHRRAVEILADPPGVGGAPR